MPSPNFQIDGHTAAPQSRLCQKRTKIQACLLRTLILLQISGHHVGSVFEGLNGRTARYRNGGQVCGQHIREPSVLRRRNDWQVLGRTIAVGLGGFRHGGCGVQQMGRTQGFNELHTSSIFFFVVLFGLCGPAVAIIIIVVVPSRLLPGALAARIRGLCGRRGRSLAGVGYNSVSIQP
jgi:hypothetical protein